GPPGPGPPGPGPPGPGPPGPIPPGPPPAPPCAAGGLKQTATPRVWMVSPKRSTIVSSPCVPSHRCAYESSPAIQKYADGWFKPS
ncbi:MAG: hypothetical protein EXS05_24325, partial [Planctomycetaceae bacterium]|nr:hypothetical protein [Planctomycetaceae bacterium]